MASSFSRFKVGQRVKADIRTPAVHTTVGGFSPGVHSMSGGVLTAYIGRGKWKMKSDDGDAFDVDEADLIAVNAAISNEAEKLVAPHWPKIKARAKDAGLNAVRLSTSTNNSSRNPVVANAIAWRARNSSFDGKSVKTGRIHKDSPMRGFYQFISDDGIMALDASDNPREAKRIAEKAGFKVHS